MTIFTFNRPNEKDRIGVVSVNCFSLLISICLYLELLVELLVGSEVLIPTTPLHKLLENSCTILQKFVHFIVSSCLLSHLVISSILKSPRTLSGVTQIKASFIRSVLSSYNSWQLHNRPSKEKFKQTQLSNLWL